MTGRAREVLSDMRPRLEAAGKDVADAKLAVKLALERRNELAVAAVDEGMAQTEVARLVEVKPPHLTRILSNAGGD